MLQKFLQQGEDRIARDTKRNQERSIQYREEARAKLYEDAKKPLKKRISLQGFKRRYN